MRGEPLTDVNADLATLCDSSNHVTALEVGELPFEELAYDLGASELPGVVLLEAPERLVQDGWFKATYQSQSDEGWFFSMDSWSALFQWGVADATVRFEDCQDLDG
ncbi:MAG: hypothetical protein AAGA48_32190 [Myxococcota bacterium]